MIDLATDFDPGATQADGSYTHAAVKNISMNVDSKRINFVYRYGTKPASVFVNGNMEALPIVAVDDATVSPALTGWTDVQAILSNASEPCLDSMYRALEQWLIDEGTVPGTIV